MTTPALAIDQAKTRVNAFIESNSNDINGLTALIVSEEVKLVTEASVTTQDMAPWNEFKESVFGKVPAPVVESAPKDNLTEAQLRDKLTVADRRLLASEAVAEDLRNKLNESNESHKVLVSEAAATTTLLEGALARLRESRAEHGEKTAADYESDKTTAVSEVEEKHKTEAAAEKDRVINETIELIEEIMDTYKGHVVEANAKYETAVLIGEEIHKHFTAMRLIANTLAEDLKTRIKPQETVTEAVSLSESARRNRMSNRSSL